MNKKFTIDVEMEERWIPHFASMLKQMERLGTIGSSRIVGIYADGDGDFRPKFEINTIFEVKDPVSNKLGNTIYDAE